MTAAVVIDSKPFKAVWPAKRVGPEILVPVNTIERKDVPAHNWDLAKQLWQNNPPDRYIPQRSHGALVADFIYPFICDLNNKRTTEELDQKYPGLAWAHETHTSRQYIMRCFVEAMIMGDAPLDVIASSAGVTEQDIWWYERAFFDVRKYLDDAAFLKLKVWYPELNTTGLVRPESIVWKLVAWKNAAGYKPFLNGFFYTDPMSDEWKEATEKITSRKESYDVLSMFMQRLPTNRNEEVIGEQFYRRIEIEKNAAPGDKQHTRLVAPFVAIIQNTFKLAQLNVVEDKGFNVFKQRASEAAATQSTEAKHEQPRAAL